MTGAEAKGAEITPLYEKLFSAQAEDFVSENAEILEGVDRIRAHTAGRGIWTIDRGQERVLKLRYGVEPIRLPGREEKLLLVVVAGFGPQPSSRRPFWDKN